MKMRSLLSLLLLISLIGLITPSAVEGQTTSLSIWPPILEVMVQPGKSVTQVYRLKNEADDTRITVRVVPFSAADEFGHINLQFGGKLPDYFSLLNADLPNLPVTLNLKAGQSQELVLKIAIPATAGEADYPAALVIESNTAGLIGGSGTVAQATIASPILLTVSKNGLPQRLIKIEDFRMTRSHLVSKQGATFPIIDSFDSIGFILRVKNQSFTRLQPVGQIKISNTFGRLVATLPLQSDHILAGTVRQLKLEGSYPSILWNPVFPLGRYTATAEITPLDTTNTVSQTITFWVLPYKALLGIGLLFFIWRGLTIMAKQPKLKS